MKYDDLVKEYEANLARVEEIDDMATVTEELKAEQDSLISAQADIEAKIERKRKQVEAGNFVKEAKANPPVEQRVVKANIIASPTPNIVDAKVIPARAFRSMSGVNSFKGADAELKAYRFGQWFMATAGMQSSIDYCNNTGMTMAVHNEGTNTQGGYGVPEEFGTDLIRLVETRGAFRPNTKVVRMTSDTRTDPRRTGGITAYWTGESQAATESTMSWDQVRLVAKKLKAITRITNELSDDNAISIGDQIMEEIAYAFATAEDQAGFNGDGTSTYGGITGVVNSLDNAAGNPTNTSAGGVYVGTGTTWGSLTLNDFEQTIAIAPLYADAGSKWFASKTFWAGVMTPLLTAAGGNTVSILQGGARVREFLGYPVELVDVMPKATAVDQIPVLFGDLKQASTMGDRMARTIKTSEHATVDGDNVFELDQLAIKGVERIDINVHDVGNTTTAGPIVGLQTKAS